VRALSQLELIFGTDKEQVGSLRVYDPLCIMLVPAGYWYHMTLYVS
jgi:hypothetical protein